jgi:hypothetical protein
MNVDTAESTAAAAPNRMSNIDPSGEGAGRGPLLSISVSDTFILLSVQPNQPVDHATSHHRST